MVREMVGGCCVCLDERGWDENPLVYCDGSGCNVAVHQACYGIVKVPSGPWFCCKCRSTERVARVKCELCPRKEGALKRTDNGGWAHVVCALYIPEVRFGNVSTMEPIIYSSVPHERFTKTCYICDENGRDSKLVNGACMACHKAGCKLAFHVTCAQGRRQLCEEASINGHVQYVGYCGIHWAKRFKQGGNQNQNQVTEQEVRKNLKEKKRSRTESTSSTNSIEQSKFNRNRRISRTHDSNNHGKSSESNVDDISPVSGDPPVFNGDSQSSGNKKASLPHTHAKQKENSQLKHRDNTFLNGLQSDSKHKISSPLNTPVIKEENNKLNSYEDKSSASSSDESAKEDIEPPKKRKVKEKEKIRKKPKLKMEDCNNNDKVNKVKKHEKVQEKKKKDKTVLKNTSKNIERKKKFPQPSQLGLVENGKVGSWESVTPKYVDPPDNFQDFLEQQWSQSAQFVLSKAEHFDVASLLTCLHQLKGDNMKLEKRLSHLQSRRDRLLGVNARLAASFTNTSEPHITSDSPRSNPLSAMLSKLNDSAEGSPAAERAEKILNIPEGSLIESESPDLAMLAAASAKLEGTSRLPVSEISPSKQIPTDEKPSTSFQNQDTVSLIQPSLSVLNALPTIDRTTFERDKMFTRP